MTRIIGDEPDQVSICKKGTGERRAEDIEIRIGAESANLSALDARRLAYALLEESDVILSVARLS